MNPLFKNNMKYKLTTDQKVTIVSIIIASAIIIASLILNRAI